MGKPTYKQFAREAVDTSVVMKIKYIGSQIAAHVSIAATTGDMTFEQGATTAAAAVGTGTNPGTSGVINISSYATIGAVIRKINLAADWEAWPVDYPMDHDIEVTAGNCIYTATLTDQDCTGVNGFAVVDDTSLETAEVWPVGVTWNGPSNKPHAHDAQVRHEIMKIVCTATFGGATDGIYIYECDDDTGEVTTEVRHLPLVTATATTWGTGDTPILSSKSRRLVFMVKDASGAITSPSMYIDVRSEAIGPAVRRSKLWVNQLD